MFENNLTEIIFKLFDVKYYFSLPFLSLAIAIRC